MHNYIYNVQAFFYTESALQRMCAVLVRTIIIIIIITIFIIIIITY